MTLPLCKRSNDGHLHGIVIVSPETRGPPRWRAWSGSSTAGSRMITPPESDIDTTPAPESKGSFPPDSKAARATPRQHLLAERAVAIGEACSARLRHELQAERRRISGGWPGTRSAMRAFVAQHFASSPPERQLKALSEAERVEVTKVAYVSASKDWLKHALREGA